METVAPRSPLEVFFSYAHEDERPRARLEKHLSTLRNAGMIADWHDGRIVPGQEWDAEIRSRIERADIILLLVSADFLDSRYIASVELQTALERHERDQAVVIPVIVRPCDWEYSPLAHLQVLPRLGKPISKWRVPDDAYLDVAQGIRRAAEQLLADRPDEPPPGPATRKRVVVASVAFSALGLVEAELRSRALAHATDVAGATLRDFGASVSSPAGGELTAVFGLPHVSDEDALRAIRAADALRRLLPSLEAELQRRFDLQVATRLAVEAGMLLVEGPAALSEAIGEASTEARELIRRAAAGETLVGDAVYRAVSHAVQVELVDTAEGEQKRRLAGLLAGARKRPQRTRSSVVGRGAESLLLQDAFERTVEGRECRLCIVTGSPGIGKSRLVHELARRVAGKAVVLRGRCVESRPSYWPLLEVIKQAASLEADDTADEVREKLVAVLGDDAALDDAEAVAGLLDLAEPSGDADGNSRAVRRLLEAVAEKTPLVVVFDDVHLATPAFFKLVEYLAGQSHGSPFLLVCLAWPELDEQRPDWCASLPNVVRLRLQPLVGADSAQLVENLLGAELDPDLRRRLAEAAGGNPLYVEEVIAMLLDGDHLTLSESMWRPRGPLPDDLFPASVDAIAAARIDALPEPEQAVVRAASVEGVRFHHDAVARLTADRLLGDVAPALTSLIRKEIVRHDRAELTGEASAFQHVVLREAAYDSAPLDAAADLHERYADWLAETTADRVAEFDETIGYHLERAYRLTVQAAGREAPHLGELGARGGRLLHAAGRRALARGDMADARGLLERAAAILPPDDRERGELLFDLGVAQMETARLKDALQTYADAAAAARANGDTRLELYARLQRSGVEFDMHPEPGARKLLEDEAKEAERICTELGDDRGLAKVWHRRAFVAAVDCRWRSAQGAFQRARRYARRAGAERDEAVASSMLFYCHVLGPANVEHAIRRSERILAQTRFRGVAGVGLAALASLHAMRGAFEEAGALLERSTTLLEDLGQVRRLNEASFFAATANLLAGDADEAIAHLQKALDATKAAGQGGLATSMYAQLAEAQFARGGYAEAEQAAEASRLSATADDVFTQMRWRPVRAKLLARDGELAEARALAREAVAIASNTDDTNAHAAALADLAEILELAGESREAAASRASAHELYAQKGNDVAAAALGRRAMPAVKGVNA